MATGSTQSSHFGQVRIGAFEEVLSFPGRYLNDHCLIRKSDVWHFFGTVGRVPSDDHHDTASEQPPNEGSFSHTTSPDLHTWQTHPDVMHVACVWPEISNVFAPRGFLLVLGCTPLGRIEASPDMRQHFDQRSGASS